MLEMTSDEAVELAEEIARLIDEEVPEYAWDKAAEFFEDIREKAIEVGETIENSGHVTDKQASALENWEAGVRRWIRD